MFDEITLPADVWEDVWIREDIAWELAHTGPEATSRAITTAPTRAHITEDA